VLPAKRVDDFSFFDVSQSLKAYLKDPRQFHDFKNDDNTTALSGFLKYRVSRLSNTPNAKTDCKSR